MYGQFHAETLCSLSYAELFSATLSESTHRVNQGTFRLSLPYLRVERKVKMLNIFEEIKIYFDAFSIK